MVATIPPTVAESRAPMSTPNASPAAATWAARVASVTPAPAVTCPATASTGPRARSRERLSTTSPASGTAPATRPVLPPWGTTATPWRRASPTTSATSAVVPGRTTAGVDPWKRRVQSVT